MESLYGDGIHDDTAAIQARLDEDGKRIELPDAVDCYLISRTLKIHSGQELVLPRFCRVKLAGMSNCTMLENADPDSRDSDIQVTGGIWDLNNLEQLPNPFQFAHDAVPDYSGNAMIFRNIKRLRLANLTFKDPTTFACTLDGVTYFSIEDINFDFNYGNPLAQNMDGIHLNGNCHFGLIRNLKGACYDDLVALNADEGSAGPISNIRLDGIFATDCHSAVRLLSDCYPVTNIHISNVFGTFYVYCITLSKYYDRCKLGRYDGIVIDNIFAAKAVNKPVYGKADDFYRSLPLIYVEAKVDVGHLAIRDVHRIEENLAIETLRIDRESVVHNLILENISMENHTGQPFLLLHNCGEISQLHTSLLDAGTDKLMLNEGFIRKHTQA